MTKQSPQNPYYLPPHPMYYHYPYYPHNLSHDYSYNNSPNLDLQASSHTFNSPTTTATKNIEKNISHMVSEKIEDIIVIDDPKDKKSVQFTLLKNDNLQQNDENITKTTRSNRSTRGKRGGKSTRGSKPTRKSPRKGGILNIAVEKIIKIPSEEDIDMQVDETQLKKSDSFMDTESDYNTQNEEIRDGSSDNFSE